MQKIQKPFQGRKDDKDDPFGTLPVKKRQKLFNSRNFAITAKRTPRVVKKRSDPPRTRTGKKAKRNLQTNQKAKKKTTIRSGLAILLEEKPGTFS
jgi:hypothetical protein